MGAKIGSKTHLFVFAPAKSSLSFRSPAYFPRDKYFKRTKAIPLTHSDDTGIYETPPSKRVQRVFPPHGMYDDRQRSGGDHEGEPVSRAKRTFR